jgi:hypothetical protein
MDSQALVKNLSLDSPPDKQTVRGIDVVQFRLGFSIEEFQ